MGRAGGKDEWNFHIKFNSAQVRNVVGHPVVRLALTCSKLLNPCLPNQLKDRFQSYEKPATALEAVPKEYPFPEGFNKYLQEGTFTLRMHLPRREAQSLPFLEGVTFGKGYSFGTASWLPTGLHNSYCTNKTANGTFQKSITKYHD